MKGFLSHPARPEDLPCWFLLYILTSAYPFLQLVITLSDTKQYPCCPKLIHTLPLLKRSTGWQNQHTYSPRWLQHLSDPAAVLCQLYTENWAIKDRWSSVSQWLSFLLEHRAVAVTGAAGSRLKRRGIFWLISAQFKILHLWWYGGAACTSGKAPSMLNDISRF